MNCTSASDAINRTSTNFLAEYGLNVSENAHRMFVCDSTTSGAATMISEGGAKLALLVFGWALVAGFC